MNREHFQNHPPSDHVNQLAAEPKSYATPQGIELSRGEYQELSK